ncbi:MAG: hypothetical protein NO516_04225 [Candidatus Methanomethylicia archaeon]|nr:hypothetical protein [Candidatus Methanomethylicia archaeon]
MVKVSFRYNQDLVAWIKSRGVGATWSREEKLWEIPDEIIDELKLKAEELGIELTIGGAQPQRKAPVAKAPSTYGGQQRDQMGYLEWDQRPATPQQKQVYEGQPSAQQPSAPASDWRKEGEIRLRRSRDGRFVLVSMNLIAFASDVQDLLSGAKTSVKFRVLPPRPPPEKRE